MDKIRKLYLKQYKKTIKARENYNKQVKTYRKYVKAFPQRIFLDLLGYEKQEFNLLDYNAPETTPQNLFGE